MQLQFIKLSHIEYQLICTIDGLEKYNKILESKSYLRHDLMHYCVETIANLQNSFFGSIAGINIVDEDELMLTERVVAMLQKMDIDQNYSPASYYKMLKNSFVYQQEPVPEFITFAFVEDCGIKFLELMQQYTNLKTGGDSRIILEF
jgi:hypothetical protein